MKRKVIPSFARLVKLKIRFPELMSEKAVAKWFLWVLEKFLNGEYESACSTFRLPGAF